MFILGSGIIKPVARLSRGRWTPDRFESMKPSVTTKICLCMAILYLLFPTDEAYITMSGIFIAMKVQSSLNIDPTITNQVHSKMFSGL